MLEDKNRHWTFVMYPESLPENYLEILQQTGLEIAISPLHNKDLDKEKELKKAHYHVLLCFPGPTTYKKVCSITQKLNATVPQRVLSVKGIYRYFTHKDNPEKYQYDEQEIVCLNGFDSENFVAMTTSQIKMIVRELTDIILTKNILEYVDLIDFLMCNEMYDFLDVASSKTIYFNTLISSLRNKSKFNVPRETL